MQISSFVYATDPDMMASVPSDREFRLISLLDSTTLMEKALLFTRLPWMGVENANLGSPDLARLRATSAKKAYDITGAAAYA